MKPPYIHYNTIHNTESATEVVPLIIKTLNPTSVIDVGCGTGDWLKVFHDLGISKIKGIDGRWLNKDKLKIPIANFEERDLTQVYKSDSVYDLAICLEVAEHLPEVTARNLVETLVGLSDTILFSAAIPNQGGQNHINEQWVDYWVQLFSEYSYHFQDSLRKHIWDDPNVFWWYKQNMYIVSSKGADQSRIDLKNAVHPELFELKNQQLEEVITGKKGVKYAITLLLKSLFLFFRKKTTK